MENDRKHADNLFRRFYDVCIFFFFKSHHYVFFFLEDFKLSLFFLESEKWIRLCILEWPPWEKMAWKYQSLFCLCWRRESIIRFEGCRLFEWLCLYFCFIGYFWFMILIHFVFVYWFDIEPSYVLRAVGVGDDLAHTSIRFGFGRFTTEQEVDYAANEVIRSVKRYVISSLHSFGCFTLHNMLCVCEE